jgi:putative DNA primase/helicase
MHRLKGGNWLPVNVDGIPRRLKEYDQWVTWRLESRQGDPKPTKIPYNPHEPTMKASSTNSATWGTFSEAVQVYSTGRFSGIGLVLSKDDPFIFIDFDHCLEDGKLNNCAFVNTSLLDSYTEVSQSGTGLHIIGEGYNPDETGTGHKKGDLEFYTKGRYVAITGTVYENRTDIKIIPQTNLKPFYEKYFISEPKPIPKRKTQSVSKAVTLSDDKIIELCSNAKNSTKFTSLWRGMTTGYNSHSEADLALASIIGFYTQDETQLERMMKTSGLFREKMDRPDYILKTIHKATSGIIEKFGDRKPTCYNCKNPLPDEIKAGDHCPNCLKRRKY